MDLIMTTYNIAGLREELNTYLMDRFEYKRSPATNNRCTISATRKRFNLYLRFGRTRHVWEEDTLVIASIYFLYARQGHGCDLLKFFVKIADKYKIRKIGIELTNEESSAFAENFGFKCFLRGYWIVSVKDLEIKLKK
ncbi:MAG: GNAT family N-acetyltransferase [Flavobacteriaceae bacterium]|nr:GNAT family N-acetyltransferase [Flavobacteriaceae bacterium]